VEEKQPFGRLKKREDNIKTDVREVGCEDGMLMELAKGRSQWCVVLRAMSNLLVVLSEIYVVNDFVN
jgi:hypothetical protein